MALLRLLSLENESDAMDVDVEYYDILPDPIGEPAQTISSCRAQSTRIRKADTTVTP